MKTSELLALRSTCLGGSNRALASNTDIAIKLLRANGVREVDYK